MAYPILVLGGAGYIGSHIVYFFKQKGLDPIVIDNLSTGNAWAASFGSFEEGDGADADFVASVCERYKPIAAVYCAGSSGIKESVGNPGSFAENNRDKAARFFKTIHAHGIDKLVFISTGAIYGDGIATYGATDGLTKLSEYYPAKPISPYAQSMFEAEVYLRMMDAVGLRSVTLRAFNIGGAAPPEAQIGEARLPEHRLIPRLFMALGDLPYELLCATGLDNGFSIYGLDYPTPDNTAIRDFLHVMDLADATFRALEYLMNGETTEIFNIGSGKACSVKEVIEAVSKVLDKPMSASFAPKREGDPIALVADRRKAEKGLGWRPTLGLRDIVADSAAWHRSSFYFEAIKAKLGLAD